MDQQDLVAALLAERYGPYWETARERDAIPAEVLRLDQHRTRRAGRPQPATDTRQAA